MSESSFSDDTRASARARAGLTSPDSIFPRLNIPCWLNPYRAISIGHAEHPSARARLSRMRASIDRHYPRDVISDDPTELGSSDARLTAVPAVGRTRDSKVRSIAIAIDVDPSPLGRFGDRLANNGVKAVRGFPCSIYSAIPSMGSAFAVQSARLLARVSRLCRGEIEIGVREAFGRG
jgi:hypothetical protein